MGPAAGAAQFGCRGSESVTRLHSKSAVGGDGQQEAWAPWLTCRFYDGSMTR